MAFRRDIRVNTKTGDMVFGNQNTLATRDFSWVSEGDIYLFGNITLPSSYSISKIYTEGVKVEIPYTPVYKPMRFRVVRDYGDGYERVLTNPTNNTEWFDVKAMLYNKEEMTPCASQLLMIGVDEYIVTVSNGTAYVWSGEQSDLISHVANVQNRNFLLKCIPSNSYRYPTSGVGTILYLHSNIENSGFAERLQDEFEDDGVTVINAAIDTETGEMELDLEYPSVDEDEDG